MGTGDIYQGKSGGNHGTKLSPVNILSLEEVANPYEREIPLYPLCKRGNLAHRSGVDVCLKLGKRFVHRRAAQLDLYLNEQLGLTIVERSGW